MIFVTPLVLGDRNPGIRFFLYTPEKPGISQEITITRDSIEQSNFRNRFTRFLIHGWRSSGESEFAISIKNALLVKGNFNVVVVDWNDIAASDYLDARYSIEILLRAMNLEFDFFQLPCKKGRKVRGEIHQLPGLRKISIRIQSGESNRSLLGCSCLWVRR